jgi:hypothetical protein
MCLDEQRYPSPEERNACQEYIKGGYWDTEFAAVRNVINIFKGHKELKKITLTDSKSLEVARNARSATAMEH